MLGKVLKYDILALGRYLWPLYIVLIGLSIMIRLFSFFDNSSIIVFLFGIFVLLFIFLGGISFVLNGIFVIKYYLENLYKDEGYLTHTLPLKNGTLLLSKVLLSLISVFMTSFVVFISVLIAFYQENLFSDMFNFLGQTFYSMKIYQFMLFMVVYAIIGYLTTILMVFASISIGYSRSFNKLVSSVMWALVFYFGMEFLYMGILGVLMEIKPPFVLALSSDSFVMMDLVNFFMVFMVITCFIGGIFYYISYRFMDKKLNLE